MKITEDNFINTILSVHDLDNVNKTNNDEFICQDGKVAEVKYGCCIYKED
jgi:hypothetical protein